MTDPRQHIDVPHPHTDSARWGSDLIADAIRALGFRHVALNPGSSFRGLHDSLVNHLGNRQPQMLLCLHEEHAVSIAHGWAKVTGQPMAVVLHANVGLMHAAMAIYNAWCDRVPMVIFGATGPVAADKRRPWIDWIHTSRDQGALVRPYVKFDDQPASLPASLSAIMRAHSVACTAPHGPTYVCFDVSVQEAPATAGIALPDPAKYAPPAPPAVAPETVAQIKAMLEAAKTPVFLMGRVSRDPRDWAWRVALAEACGAKVITDIKTGANFPTAHPAHSGPPSFFLADAPAKDLAKADQDAEAAFDIGERLVASHGLFRRQVGSVGQQGKLSVEELGTGDDEITTLVAASAKMFASEMVGRVADRAVQIHGGAGYMAEYAVERFYRDVRLFRIFEGTTQIQQTIIARELKSRFERDGAFYL